MLASIEISPEEINKSIYENALNSIEAYFETLKDNEEQQDIKEKIAGGEIMMIRAAMYFLKNLSGEENQQLKVENEEFSSNILMQELVIGRLLKYNPITEILSFDKGFLPTVLTKCSYWKLTSSWLDMKRNKFAYDKLCTSLATDNIS